MKEPMSAYSVFLSHNSQDKEFVKRVEHVLEQAGHKCFLDEYIGPGEDWLSKLDSSLTQFKFFILFIGSYGMGPWQKQEADSTLQRMALGEDIVFLPVLLPGIHPEQLENFNIFFHGKNALRWNEQYAHQCLNVLIAVIEGSDPSHIRQLLKQANIPSDLYASINQNFSGIHISFDGNDCSVIQGRGKKSLKIPSKPGVIDINNVQSVLNWEFRLTPLLGRDTELQVLLDWSRPNIPHRERHGLDLQIHTITGEGGAGKTRLAFELCEVLRKQGWAAGEAQGLAGEWFTTAQPESAGTLLVIDYPEKYPHSVSRFLSALYTSALIGTFRILLLSRDIRYIEPLLGKCAAVHNSSMLEHFHQCKNISAWEFYRQVQQTLRGDENRQKELTLLTEGALTNWLAQYNIAPLPLYLIAIALHRELDRKPVFREISLGDIFNELVEREVRTIEQEACNILGEDGRNKGIHGWCLLKALAAVSSGLDENAIDTMAKLSVDYQCPLPNSTDIKRSSLWQASQKMGGTGRIAPVQPEIFAAAFLHYCLWNFAGQHACHYLLAAFETNEDLFNSLSNYGRIHYDAAQRLGFNWPQEPLIHKLLTDETRQEIYCLALQENYLSPALQAISLPLTKARVELYEQLAEHNFSVYAPDLASNLHNFSIHLGKADKRDAALTASQRAVELYEQLAEKDFAAYALGLARSLMNLSVRLADANKPDDALIASQRTVELYEQLAEKDFAAYAPDLAGSLNNLSVDLAEGDKPDAALSSSQRAVELYEQLAGKDFATYAPDLASSLHNLSIHLSKAGERDAALTAIQRAVEIDEQLSRQNFAAYAPDLTGSLMYLSASLAEAGKRDAALTANQRAVELYELLARQNFASYAPDLVSSLNKLSVCLIEAGDPFESKNAVQHAAMIRKQLASQAD